MKAVQRRISNIEHGTSNTEGTAEVPQRSVYEVAGRARISRSWRAFSLIELLVVIGVISVLASLIFPIAGVVKKNEKIGAAKAEMGEIQTAIEAYKAKLGSYPPDNPGNPVINQLYYELQGMIRTKSGFRTLDGSITLTLAQVTSGYSPQVSGFMNSSASVSNSDESATAVNFLRSGLRPNQVCLLNDGINILVCSVAWENGDTNTWPVQKSDFRNEPPAVNPWRYVSTNPTNSPGTYDLWADLYLKGKIYRVCNWSKEPVVISP